MEDFGARALLPAALLEGGPRVVRPAELAGTYAEPAKQLHRLTGRGVVRRLAHGYYALVPLAAWSDPSWKPSIEGVAAAIAVTSYGEAAVALMGVSAARVLGALPRAHGVGVVAVPRQRKPLRTFAGVVEFVRREVAALDLERHDTDLGSTWVTTAEQTLLDLSARPTLGQLAQRESEQVQAELAQRVDWPQIRDLAREQRKLLAFNTALERYGPRHIEPLRAGDAARPVHRG